MPRNVRNFWVEAAVEGRASPFSGGPKSKSGGLDVDVAIREGGSISRKTVTIHGSVIDEGRKLRLLVNGVEGGAVVWSHEIITER